MKKTIIIILDSVGCGALPDAEEYGDEGSNTLGNLAKAVSGLDIINLRKLGIGNIIDVAGGLPEKNPLAGFGKLAEKSKGKDTTTGHWELMGIILDKPFPVYPEGFPSDLIEEFEKLTGYKSLGNKPASGTEIIKELGEEHIKTGSLIVYTSADSVFQIAAHEEVVPINELYRICKIAREKVLVGNHAVGRVIARPFIGKTGNFTRTTNRKDFSLKPPHKTVLDFASEAGIDVYGVGKIGEIFANQGIKECRHIDNNMDGINQTLKFMEFVDKGIIFTNLVDFDMLWGHRNDFANYARGLETVDRRIPEIISKLKPSDVLIITADHGCDPTTESTDHSREYVPFLVYGEYIKAGYNLGIRNSFADVGKTIAEALGFEALTYGESFFGEIFKGW
ncbi:MAG: phosphopentomutase [Actinobacteria bacterium]|nr:phosphopentomutase [Actinomycetota bacterium]